MHVVKSKMSFVFEQVIMFIYYKIDQINKYSSFNQINGHEIQNN